MWFTFLTGALGRRLLGGLAIVLALAFVWRTATNRAWQQGFDKGEKNGVAEITKAREAQWKLETERLEKMAVALADGIGKLDAERQEAARLRMGMRNDLKAGLNQLQGSWKQQSEDIAKVPAGELDPRIKQELAKLREP